MDIGDGVTTCDAAGTRQYVQNGEMGLTGEYSSITKICKKIGNQKWRRQFLFELRSKIKFSVSF